MTWQVRGPSQDCHELWLSRWFGYVTMCPCCFSFKSFKSALFVVMLSRYISPWLLKSGCGLKHHPGRVTAIPSATWPVREPFGAMGIHIPYWMRSQLEQCPNHMVSQRCPDGISCKYVQRLLNEPTATDDGHEMMSFFSSRFPILGTGLSKWSECEDVKIQVSHWCMLQ